MCFPDAMDQTYALVFTAGTLPTEPSPQLPLLIFMPKEIFCVVVNQPVLAGCSLAGFM